MVEETPAHEDSNRRIRETQEGRAVIRISRRCEPGACSIETAAPAAVGDGLNKAGFP